MKNLFLSKDTNGVSGGIHIFLRKPYGGGQIGATRQVQGQKGPQTVTQVDGSLKVDDLLAKQLKYFFGMGWPVGSPQWAYLPVRLSLWNNAATSFGRMNPAEGDRVIFFVRGVKITSFAKKDGSTGYQLDATAYDFCRVAQANPQTGTQAAAPAPAMYPQQQPMGYPASAPAPAYPAPAAPQTAPAYAAPTPAPAPAPMPAAPVAAPAPQMAPAAPAPTVAPTPAPAPAAPQTAPTTPAQTSTIPSPTGGSTSPYGPEDFAAISDSDDLPF